MAIYRKVYYDLTSGQIIYHCSFGSKGFVKTTLDLDYEIIQPLKERVKSTIGLLEFNNDNFDQDFSICTGVRVNLDTKGLEFTYPQEGESTEPVFQKPLTEQVTELKTENAELKQQLVQQNIDLQGFMDFYFSTLA
jgi:hypothetical protein